jgi:mannuronan synthase
MSASAGKSAEGWSWGLLLYGLVLLALGVAAPSSWWDPHAPGFLLALGLIAAWRYSWGAVHLARALIFRKIVFPRLRRQAEALGEGGLPSHTYLLLTSFRIDTETTREVYSAALEEAAAATTPTTVVCSIVEMCDQRLIKQLFAAFDPPPHVTLAFVRIAGTGKRDALAQGMRAISAMNPPHDAVVAVIDGDSILETGLLRATLPFFKLMPRMDALTTDEVCEVRGALAYREWYNLRFAQRQVQMCSVALSRRVLTLTGRMAMFRARVVTDPDFIRLMETDSVNHWRLGRFQFLTGDDKTSWYHILKSGREMLYVPDVRVITVETPPDENFLSGATALMVRWFGNMLRTNARAIRVGPRRAGLFVWWVILDQRISMWTTLIGPMACLLATLFVTPAALFLYLYWVGLTRLLQTLSLLTVRRRVSWRWPFFLFFNQVWGSLVKTYILFRQNRQKWTRQNTTSAADPNRLRGRILAASSWSAHAVSLLIFAVSLSLALGLTDLEALTLFAPR